jgi:hypothetical protein
MESIIMETVAGLPLLVDVQMLKAMTPQFLKQWYMR